MTPEKKRMFIFAGISVLIAGGLGTLLYFQREGIDQRRAEVAKLKQSIEDDKKLLEKTPDLTKKVIIQRETDSVVKEILSDEKDVTDLARTLNKYSEEAGFTLQQVKDGTRAAKKSKEEFERVPYTLVFEADAFQLLSFLDKIESHKRFMSVTSLKLQAARRNDYTGDALPRHRVTLELETYVYAPTGAAKEVKIDGYEKKKELLISEISKRVSELRVPSYEYRGQRARRDPWIDPRVPVDGGEHMPIEDQISLVDDLAEKAEEIQKVWTDAQAATTLIETMKLRADLEAKLGLLEEEIRRVDQNGLLVFVPALRRFDKSVVEVVSTVREQMTKGDNGAGPSTALLRETSEAMERHIDLQEYELALAAYATIEPKLGLADQDPLKEPLVKSIRELKNLADTVIAFEKIPLQIGGVALYENRPPVALINGQAYSEGEMVDQELFVHNIRTDQIEFAFHELILAKPLDAKPTGSAKP